MIPDASRCADVVEAACPGLYNEFVALRDAVYASVMSAVGETPCGEDLDRAVVLDPVSIGPGNHVLVIPENISTERPRSSKSPLMVMTRLKVSAVVAIILEGYPIADIEGDHILLPSAEEYDGASKFVTSIGWCVMCSLRDAINAGNLFGELDQGRDITVTAAEFSDSGAGQATISLRVSWLSP